MRPSTIPIGRAPRVLFSLGLALVAIATVMGQRILMPDLLEIIVPPDFFPVEGWQAGALFTTGFVLVAGAQVVGSARKSSEPASIPAAPAGALLPGVPEDVEKVRKAVADKMGPKKTTLTHVLALFAISLLLFTFQIDLQHDFYFMWIVALFVVLFVHELGHLLAMWAFGYTELRMFFIPMFGAAVSGRKHDATATQRAIVSLMGPAPGLAFALIAMFFAPFESRFLHDIAQLALIINAFNLLPFVPLDGGNVLDVTLFARWPKSRQIMGHVSGLAIATIGWLFEAWVLTGVGLITFITAGRSTLIAAVARDLREKLDSASTASFVPSVEAIPAAITSVNARVFSLTPMKPTPKRYANVITGAWPLVRSLSPSARRIVLLLGAYAACFLMVAIAWLTYVAAVSNQGSYTWHANGQPRSFGKSGIDGHEGEWTYWHANGAKKAEGVFVDVGKQGPWQFWHPNGAEKAVGAFVDASKDGAWRYWYADGSLKSEGNYEVGQKIGMWNFRSEDGIQEPEDFGALPPPAVLARDEGHTQMKLHFDNAKSMSLALDCAERAFLVAEQFLPQASAEAELAEFHLFRTRDDYRLAEWRETEGRFKDGKAFTLYGSALTYVYVTPATSDEELDRIGLPLSTTKRISRAAALNTLAWRMPAFRELPGWLKSGFRAYVAHGATSPGAAPIREASWFARARRMATESRLPLASEIIMTSLEGFKNGERDALNATLFGLMAEGDELPVLFHALAQHAKGDSAEFQATLKTWLSPARLESLDVRFFAFVNE